MTQPSDPFTDSGFAVYKDWDFGTNITSDADLEANFSFVDQFGQTTNGNYGAVMVAPDVAHAVPGQPVDGIDTASPIRVFTADSMLTYVLPLDGATACIPSALNCGSGAFQALSVLPAGGSILGQDFLWETRVRFQPPPYYWFALWTDGNRWSNGPEIDLVETYGWSNGADDNNFAGAYWHSNAFGGADAVDYGSWPSGMASVGITNFDPTEWHVWQLLYTADNSYAMYVDGAAIQSGSNYPWTVGAVAGGTPINVSLLFDATWGSRTVGNNEGAIDASELAGTYYEWDYSRVFLRAPASVPALGAHAYVLAAALAFVGTLVAARPRTAG